MTRSTDIRVHEFLQGFRQAYHAYWEGDLDAAILLLYDLISDLQRLRTVILDERFALRSTEPVEGVAEAVSARGAAAPLK